MQFTLSGFGGSFKRTPAFKSEGRCQDLIYKGSGLEESDLMWRSLQECFSTPFLSSTSAALERYMTNVLAASWMYGMDSQHHHLNLAPNGLGAFRALVSGEVKWALMELRSLIPALKIKWSKDNFGLNELLTQMQSLTASDISELVALGCDVEWCVQAPGTVLFTPLAGCQSK